jgi:hypothetical protein
MSRQRNPWLPSPEALFTGVGDTAAGFVQGASFNFLDDLLRAVTQNEQADNFLAEAQARNPFWYGAGNFAGALTGPMKIPFPRGDFVQAGVASALDALPTRLLAKGLRGTSDDLSALTAGQFLKRAAANDAAAGGLYAAGGYDVAEDGGDDSALTLAQKALVHGAAGAAAGAASAAAIPALGRYWQRSQLNAPTARGEAPLDAPLALTPATLAGRNLTRAQPEELREAAFGLVDEALARDEAIRRLQSVDPVIQTGMPVRTVLDAAGPNVQSLFGVIARDPEGRAMLLDHVANSARENVRAKLAALHFDGLPVSTRRVVQDGEKTVTRPLLKPSTSLVQDLVDAIDDPDAHQQWLRLAKTLHKSGRTAPPQLKQRANETDAGFADRQRAQADAFERDRPRRDAATTARREEARDLAQQVVHGLKQRVDRASGEEALELFRRLENGDLAEKLRAVGLRIEAPKDLSAGLARSDQSLRAVVGAGANPSFMRVVEQVTRDPKTAAPVRGRSAMEATEDNLTARSPNRRAVGREDLSDAPPAPVAPELRNYLVDALTAPRRLSFVPASRSEAPLLGLAPDFTPRRVDWRAATTGADKGFYYAGKGLPILGDQIITSDDNVATGFFDLVRYYLDLAREQGQTSRNATSRNPWLPAFDAA